MCQGSTDRAGCAVIDEQLWSADLLMRDGTYSGASYASFLSPPWNLRNQP